MLIFRRSNFIITASVIITLCKRLYSTPVESGQNTKTKLYKNNATIWYGKTCSRLLSTGVLYSRLQRVAIPDAVIIQFHLLKMSMVLLETCRGL